MATTRDPRPEAEPLRTVRDLWRFAVTRFSAAGLAYGHGTDNAVDEAAFLVVSALRLPIDRLEPFLDARLLPEERAKILTLIENRITTRKPMSYLVGEAYIQGHRFVVDERVIVPRSYIGELLCTRPELLANDGAGPKRILDLCTGSGCLAILAALAWPDAHVDGSDVSPAALEVARRNVADYGLASRVSLIEGDLFQPLKGRRYDMIVSNPPYVAAAEADAFPPEYAAEPGLAHRGGDDGLAIVRRILAGARDHLTPEGALVIEVGTGGSRLMDELPNADILWLSTEDSEGEVALIARDCL